jgi:hypothetical protein
MPWAAGRSTAPGRARVPARSSARIGPLTHDNMTGIRAPRGDRPSFWLHKLSRVRKSGPFVSSALAFDPPLMTGDGNGFYLPPSTSRAGARPFSCRRVFVLGQGALGLMPMALTKARQAALDGLVEVAWDGAPGDVGGGSALVVGQAVALEPKDLHLELDAGVGVVRPVVGQGFAVFLGEGERAPEGSPRCCVSSRSPSGVNPHARPPTICVRLGHAEYSRRRRRWRRVANRISGA